MLRFDPRHEDIGPVPSGRTFANALKAARQLGHTDATTMLRWYARWLPRPGKRAVDMLDDALGRAIVVLGEAPSGTVGSQSGV